MKEEVVIFLIVENRKHFVNEYFIFENFSCGWTRCTRFAIPHRLVKSGKLCRKYCYREKQASTGMTKKYIVVYPSRLVLQLCPRKNVTNMQTIQTYSQLLQQNPHQNRFSANYHFTVRAFVDLGTAWYWVLNFFECSSTDSPGDQTDANFSTLASSTFRCGSSEYRRPI